MDVSYFESESNSSTNETDWIAVIDSELFKVQFYSDTIIGI